MHSPEGKRGRRQHPGDLLNDACGHLAGDECLKKIGGVAVAARHRSADIAARYGGDEFVCILPDTPAQGGKRVAEIIRRGIASLAIPNAGSRVATHVTARLGVCTLACQPGIAPAGIIAAADECLYQAKLAGRNCVVGVEI